MKTIVLGILIAGCATSQAVPTETVGNLSASYHSVAVQPVHATTDLTPSFGVVDTEEATVVVSLATDVTPDVTPKGDGITVGPLTPVTNQGK